MLKAEYLPRPNTLAALPIFPLPNLVLFPGMLLPLNVFEPRYLDLVDHVVKHTQYFGIPLLQAGANSEKHGSPAIEPIFGIGKLRSHLHLKDGRRIIRIEGMGRVRLLQEAKSSHRFREVKVEMLPESYPQNLQKFHILKAQVERITQLCPVSERELIRSVLAIQDACLFLYTLTTLAPCLAMFVGGDDMDWADFSPYQQIRLQQQSLAAESCDQRVVLLLDYVNQTWQNLLTRVRIPACMFN